jgi:hypothetical protein
MTVDEAMVDDVSGDWRIATIVVGHSQFQIPKGRKKRKDQKTIKSIEQLSQTSYNFNSYAPGRSGQTVDIHPGERFEVHPGEIITVR